MTGVALLGAAMTAAGLALLAVVILRARRLRRDAPDPAATQARLTGLVALNFGAVALSFLGLGVVLVGLLL